MCPAEQLVNRRGFVCGPLVFVAFKLILFSAAVPCSYVT